MAENFYTILTTVGKAKIANASALGTKINLTTFVVGDSNGVYYNPTEDQTALRKEVWRGNISSIGIDKENSNWIVLETVIPSTDGGFMVREAGVLDVEGNLIAIGKYPETYKPIVSEGSAKDLYIRMILEVSNAASVTLKIDPSVVLATKKDIEVITSSMGDLAKKVSKNTEDISTFKTNGIGGRNLVLDSLNLQNQFKKADGFEGTISKRADPYPTSKWMFKIQCTKNGGYFHFPIFLKTGEKVGRTYTYSFYILCNKNIKMKLGHQCGGEKEVYATQAWKKITHTWKFTDETHSSFYFTSVDGWDVGDIIYIADMKIEEGTVPSTWTPAPEDLSSQLADIMTQLNNYNSYSSGKDSNGIFIIVEYKRSDTTLYMKSTLSNVDTNGNYKTDTWQFYDNTGINVIKTLTWTITYDSEGKITSKVVA